MYRTFNCGVGMVICVAPEHAEQALELLRAAGQHSWEIGRVTAGEPEVELVS